MNRYEFTVTLTGIGNTLETAWQDAVEQFQSDPGSPPLEDGPDVSVYEEETNTPEAAKVTP